MSVADDAAVLDALLALVEREFAPAHGAVTGDLALFEGGLDLDSFAVVELITRVEQTFAFQFAESDLRPESFTSLGRVAEIVLARLQAPLR